jgi:hypothetical protein
MLNRENFDPVSPNSGDEAEWALQHLTKVGLRVFTESPARDWREASLRIFAAAVM